MRNSKRKNNDFRGKWDCQWVEGVPQVERGESLYALLRFALLYNGERFMQDIDDFEVSFP